MQLFQIFAIACALVVFALVIDFIRRGLLKERYSVFWIAASIVFIVLSFWRGLVDRVAAFFGISYGPTLLFLVAFVFITLIILHYSVVISIFHERNKTLSQEVTLLKEALEELRRTVDKDKRA